MATKLTIKSETNYRDIVETDMTENKIAVESYAEGKTDTLPWRFEQFCKFLLADGYSIGNINKYISFDGEVYEREDVE